jgi:hypothetical protein
MSALEQLPRHTRAPPDKHDVGTRAAGPGSPSSALDINCRFP